MDNDAIKEALSRRQGQQPTAQPQRPPNMAGGSPLVNQIKNAPEDKELLIIKALIQKLRDMSPKEPT